MAADRPSASPRSPGAPRAPASRGGRARSRSLPPEPCSRECPACSVAGSSCSACWLASSFSRFARRSAPRRLLTKRIVEVCAWTSSSSFGYIAGQIEFWVGAASKLASGNSGSPSLAGAGATRPGRSCPRPGTTISRSSFLRMPALTTEHSRFGPTRKLAILSSGRCVAERPMRWTVASGPRPSS